MNALRRALEGVLASGVQILDDGVGSRALLLEAEV
jgi:hypothetical protein